MKIDSLKGRQLPLSLFGIYIHFPFCVKKCLYCDFYSCAVSELSADVFREYLEALKNDVGQWDIRTLLTSSPRPSPKGEGGSCCTIYLGGGTPSVFLVELMSELFEYLYSYFPKDTVNEITIEVNPATVDMKKLQAYREMGITRVSLGIQSFIDAELNVLGRVHTVAQAREAYRLIRAAGFSNVSIDLMFRIPEQTVDTLLQSLQAAVALDPEHISIYSLTLEEGTPLEKKVSRKELMIPDEDVDHEMYALIRNVLSEHGYDQYEISNFSKPGYACAHNLNYWRGGEYIGLGAGAHSYVNGIRWYNPDSLEQYINSSGKNREKSGKITLGEAVFLGLREAGGLDLNDFKARYGVELVAQFPQQIDKLKKSGLLQEKSGHLCLTEKGIFLANQVFVEFV